MVEYSYDPDDYRPRFDRRDDWRMEAMMDEARRELERPEREPDPLVRVVNDPTIKITPTIMKAINDPKKVMLPNRQIVKATAPAAASFAQQMGRSPIYPPTAMKRTRKIGKRDRTMSSCLKEANARGKLKNGKFRKGWTQSRIMKYAHKLCNKKMGTKKGQVRKTARRAYKK